MTIFWSAKHQQGKQTASDYEKPQLMTLPVRFFINNGPDSINYKEKKSHNLVKSK
jgi:hypothetical protein